MIPIYQPYIKNYSQSAINAINTEWISNHGIYITLAETELKNILGIDHCILMANGTLAVSSMFKALKHFHPDISKIYIPNYVFIAPWNCAVSEYDISMFEVLKTDSDTMNIDTEESYIMTLQKNAVVVVVHNLGHIVNVPRLARLRPDLIFIEDNCEGVFGKYEGMYTGSCKQTFCSAISFYGNKTLTTGEGGAFLVNDKDVYNYIRKYHSHGMTTQRYVHDIVASNHRMTNIQAGFLYDQLMDVNNILTIKQNIFNLYDEGFKDIKGIKTVKSEYDTERACWIYVILIDNSLIFEELEQIFNKRDIEIRPIFYDIHKHIHLSKIHKSFQETNLNGIMLPSSPSISEDEINYVIKTTIDIIQKCLP